MFKVLIIDDSKSVHAFVKECLKKATHTLTQAFNGEEGLQVLANPEHAKGFDLILLDWEMPKLTGPETMQAIKKKNIQTPVIMMTTKNAVEDIQQMFAAGVAEYMMKPFTMDIFFEKIEAVLGKTVRDAA